MHGTGVLPTIGNHCAVVQCISFLVLPIDDPIRMGGAAAEEVTLADSNIRPHVWHRGSGRFVPNALQQRDVVVLAGQLSPGLCR